MSEPTTDYTVVSAEDSQGRILSGVGVDVERLEQTVERHEPDVPAAPAAPSPEAPKEPRGRIRFSKLTSELEDTRKAREAAEKERDELRAQLAAGAPRPAAATREPNERVAPADRPARPAEPDFEKDYEGQVGTKYQTYGQAVQAFQRDHTQWSLNDVDARVRAGIDADHSHRAFRETVSSVEERGRKAYPDYDAILRSGPGASTILGPTPQSGDARIRHLLQLPHSEHAQYAIAKDAALAQKLASMSDFEFGIAVAALAPAPAVAVPASTAVVGSSMPPPPYQPVSGGSKTTAPPLDDLVKRGGHDFDKSGYREKRAEQLGRLRRR